MVTQTPSWMVFAWPPLLCQAGEAPPLRFSHLGTRVLSVGDEGMPSTGQTVWGETTDQRAAGVAWDWVEISGGIVAMADPLGLISNLRFVSEDGEPLAERDAALRLHRMVYALPWQTEVRRALHAQDA